MWKVFTLASIEHSFRCRPGYLCYSFIGLPGSVVERRGRLGYCFNSDD